TPVVLKAETVDADGIVTLGELFDGAGEASSAPIATRAGPSVILDALAVQAAARRAGLDWANAQGIRRIVVTGGQAAAGAGPVRGNVEALTYARSLATGEIVGPADLVWAKVAGAPGDAPSDAQAVIGMAARRPLRAGAAVSGRDIGAPQIIKAGEMIAVTYVDGPISLTLQAKALGAAAAGELLKVQNLDSKKVLQAVAAAPGEAVVGPAALQLKSARYAQR
ncbi:MAG: flagellar basal body P-ring formation chaperone FlgA, partial [Phenylobacterium sp.]